MNSPPGYERVQNGLIAVNLVDGFRLPLVYFSCGIYHRVYFLLVIVMSKEPKPTAQPKPRASASKKPSETAPSINSKDKTVVEKSPCAVRKPSNTSLTSGRPEARTAATAGKKSVSKKNTSQPAASDSVVPALLTPPSQETINQMISEAAYYLAEKRQFAPGFEEQDWREAKVQILTQLAKSRAKP